MDKDALADLIDAIIAAEEHMAHARRVAAAIGHPHYNAIAMQAREISDLYDLIARDANKETGK